MKITNVEITTNQYGESKKLTLDDDKVVFVGAKHSKYSSLEEGAELEESDLEEKTSKSGSKYYSLKSAGRGNYRTQQITETMEKKSENIRKAQERNEMMWAKVNASNLVAHHPAFKDLSVKEVEDKVIELAGKILNNQLTPF